MAHRRKRVVVEAREQRMNSPRLSRVLAVLVTLAAGASAGAAQAPDRLVDGDGAPRPLPAPAIVLFWASWCAPCRVELEMLDPLAAAASPTPVIVIPMDESRTTVALLAGIDPARIRYVPSGAYRLLRTLAGDSGALPVSVALEPSGAVCAIKQGALSVAEAGAWARRCGVTGGKQP